MKIITLLAAAALLAGSSAFGYAASKGSNATGGASEYSPGDEMRDSGGPGTGAQGASEYSPGDEMRGLWWTKEGRPRSLGIFAGR